MRACARLTAVLGDLNAGCAAFDHLGDVGRDRNLGLICIDCCDRACDREATLRSVAGSDDFFEHRGLLAHGENRADRATIGNVYSLDRRTVSDAACAHCLCACWDAANREAAIGSGDRTATSSFDEDANIGHTLLGVSVNDSTRDGAAWRNRVLGAQAYRP